MESARNRVVKILRTSVPGFREDLPIPKQVDSLTLIQLVDDLERAFSVEIASMELVPANLESVDSILALLMRKSSQVAK